MLKRAGIFMIVAFIAALFGFGGLFDGAAAVAQVVFAVAAGFCLLSLLFSLFEPSEEQPTARTLSSR